MEQKELQIKEQQKLATELVSAWLNRALGKSSHAGFNSCIFYALDYINFMNPTIFDIQEIKKKISNSSLHFTEPIREVLYEIKDKTNIAVHGDMPTIENIQKRFDLFFDN